MSASVGSERIVAVVDVGSNSGRVVVAALREGHLFVLADSRVPLRLAEELRRGKLGKQAIARTVDALRDFAAIARSAGADEVAVVATSAVRESSNRQDLVDAVEAETGLVVRVISGEEEARYSLEGAVSGLEADHGLLLDVGGGSVEVAQMTDRRLVRSWTLPLGSLRLSEAFLEHDPPSTFEVGRLRDHVADSIAEAGMPPLEPGGLLIGTGGTVRNIAKMDRRERSYPIPRLHGYVLHAARVEDWTERLRSRPYDKRVRIPGLNHDRADSIVGGAIVVETILKECGAASLVVSGRGLREGVALELLAPGVVPSPQQVRMASIGSLTARFATFDARRAERRAGIAATMLGMLIPDAPGEIGEMLRHAAYVVDIGHAIDFYNRIDHAADIVIQSDLAGFTHEHLALLTLLLRRSDDDGAGKAFRRILPARLAGPSAGASLILAVAEEVERRMPRVNGTPFACESRKREIVLRAPLPAGSWLLPLSDRVRWTFGKTLRWESEDPS